MPDANQSLQDQVIHALHNLKNRSKAIEKVSDAPGVSRNEVTILVDQTMAKNRRDGRIAGVVMVVLGAVVAFIVYLVLIFTGRLFYVIAIGAPIFVLIGLYKLVLPSPYINSKLEAAENK